MSFLMGKILSGPIGSDKANLSPVLSVRTLP